MPVETIFVCGHCGTKADPSVGPPLTWFMVSGPLYPRDTNSPNGTEYFDKVTCMLAFVQPLEPAPVETTAAPASADQTEVAAPAEQVPEEPAP